MRISQREVAHLQPNSCGMQSEAAVDDAYLLVQNRASDHPILLE